MTPSVSNCPAVAPTGELDNADQLGREVIRLMRLIHKKKSHVTKQGPDGIERAAYSILFLLVHEGPQRASWIAESLHSEISTISRQSSALVQHGLIERQPDPEDGRACLLAPTSEGLRVFEENRKLRNHWLASILAEWTDSDRANLITLLDRLNTGIESLNVEPLTSQSVDEKLSAKVLGGTH